MYNKFIVVKTHEVTGKWNAAIFLLRSPYEAIESHYNYKSTASHTATRSGYLEIYFSDILMCVCV